jgi:hypothetical protein
MRTTILSLVGLTLSASISAAPAQSKPVTECTKATLHAECITQTTTKKLGVLAAVDVKGKCVPQRLESGASELVRDTAACSCSRQAGPRIWGACDLLILWEFIDIAFEADNFHVVECL